MTDTPEDDLFDDDPEGWDDVLPYGTKRPEYSDGDPLPSWVEDLRDHQVDAIREAVEHYRDGVDVVFMDAPVGSGKTLIGDLVPRELANIGLLDPNDKRLYVCSDKALQRQFDADFPYSRLLMGRANYPTLEGPYDITCDDCTSSGPGDPCAWCDPTYLCPYRQAKQAALAAPVAVLNTSMFLTIGNFTRDWRRNKFVIADEADLLEDALLGFSEYEVPAWIGRLVGLRYPKKGVHKPTIINWLRETADQADEWLHDHADQLEPKQRRRMASFVLESRMVADQIQIDVNNAATHEDDDSDTEEGGYWIREYETRTFKMLPVTVAAYGVKDLWRHGKRWLLMSGTIISADQMADDLGLPLDYATVTVPSPFPIENRPIILAPIANMSVKEYDRNRNRNPLYDVEHDNMAYAIEQQAERHDGRGLIHTHSYKLANELMNRVNLGRRPMITYTASHEKEAAINQFLNTRGAIMFAPSMDRGVDLKGDRCEWQNIAKCPFPYLGDRQVSARTRLPNGWAWYSTRTVRGIVQMYGRIIRTPTDVGTTYICDSQFTTNVWGRNKHLFPKYFTEAVDNRADIRWMIRGGR